MRPEDIPYLIIALAVCISVHEAAHAWVAYKLGDLTAKMEGRVSLNPLKHLDPIGTIMIFIAQFGWGKPTPYNPRNLSHPKRDAALIAVAGPISNLLTAFIASLIMRFGDLMPHPVYWAIFNVYYLSIALFLFNLLPIAPLDGSKFIHIFIPPEKEEWYQHFLSQGYIYLIILIVGDRLIEQSGGPSFLQIFFQYGYEIISIIFFLGAPPL